MRLSDLKKLVAVWQERIGLQEWTLKDVRFATPEEAEEDWAKICDLNAHTKEACMVVVDPDTYDDEDKQRAERHVEINIIHELLHLHFAPFETANDSGLGVVEENIVNFVSRLLIAVREQDDKYLGRKLSRRATLNPKKPRAAKTTHTETTLQEETVVKEAD